MWTDYMRFSRAGVTGRAVQGPSTGSVGSDTDTYAAFTLRGGRVACCTRASHISSCLWFLKQSVVLAPMFCRLLALDEKFKRDVATLQEDLESWMGSKKKPSQSNRRIWHSDTCLWMFT